MKKNIATKQDEIDILQSLKGDTYFSQYFKDEDIDQMCENIRNDFPIECGCKFSRSEAILQERLKMNIESQTNLFNKFACGTVDLLGGKVTENQLRYLVEFVLLKDIIIYQREKGYPLIDCEIDYLVSKLNEQA